MKVDRQLELVVNWELAKKIVVNWELSTPISTLLIKKTIQNPFFHQSFKQKLDKNHKNKKNKNIL